MNHIDGEYPQSSVDPSSFRAKYASITSLVYGYTRQIKQSLKIQHIPTEIIEIILKYYPKKYEVLSIGRNLFGEFGLNEDTENNNQYIPLTQFASLCYHHDEIYCGFFTFTVRTEHNEFYGCGNNCDGQLGVNIHEYNVTQFNKIPFHNDHICLFSDGAFSWHRIFVTDSNQFYGFGRNKNSTLGHPKYPEKNYKPIALYNLTQLFTHTLHYKIKSIQCGASHTLFLCQNGKLFSVGENDHGQCGIHTANKMHIMLPTEITHIPRIIDMAVGEYFSLCISQTHDLWVFGSNNNYELGIDRDWNQLQSDDADDDDDDDDDDNLDIWIPKRNNYFYDRNIKIDKIRCGESHSLVIGSDAEHHGFVYCCGQNTHGESLGKYLDPETQHKYDPICFQSAICDHELKIVIEDASCGNTHTMLLTDTNEIYGFGANDHGQVAVGIKETKIHKPYLLKKAQIGIDDDNHIERVIAGCYTTLIVCNRL